MNSCLGSANGCIVCCSKIISNTTASAMHKCVAITYTLYDKVCISVAKRH